MQSLVSTPTTDHTHYIVSDPRFFFVSFFTPLCLALLRFPKPNASLLALSTKSCNNYFARRINNAEHFSSFFFFFSWGANTSSINISNGCEECKKQPDVQILSFVRTRSRRAAHGGCCSSLGGGCFWFFFSISAGQEGGSRGRSRRGWISGPLLAPFAPAGARTDVPGTLRLFVRTIVLFGNAAHAPREGED